MGSDAAEVVEGNLSFKVHHAMCKVLMGLVDRLSSILPDIEAARPRCLSGIQALCMLNQAIEKARLLLRHCCDSSVLYLALTGDAIAARCERARSLSEQSLGQLQSMVPVLLAIEVSRLLDDLRSMTFVLESSEEEAGKVIRDLIHQVPSESASTEISNIESFSFVASKLHICSQKSILIEKRSIKKLLSSVGDTDPKKMKILMYFLDLLKKYGNSISTEPIECVYIENERLNISTLRCKSAYEDPVMIEDCENGKSEADTVTTLPEEFICPLSLKLMYEPVVIASGQTFERMWIQKWLDEGHDSCPKTKIKLAHSVMTPNTTMKSLISKWCKEHDIVIPNPIRDFESLRSWDNSCTSIASLGSSMNDLRLRIDLSNVSIGSVDTSYSSNSSVRKDAVQNRNRLLNEEILRSLSKLTELQWQSQCKVIEDVSSSLEGNYLDIHSESSQNILEPLIRFLGEAQSQGDIKAQKTVSQLLLALYLKKSRCEVVDINEDALSILASAVDSEVASDALAILEILSSASDFGLKSSASGALDMIVRTLNSQSRDFQESSLRILCNLSSSIVNCPCLLPCIPRVVQFLKDSALAKFALRVLANLCNTEDGKICITETKGCIAAIAELLESDNNKDQEESVSILLLLCSQRVQYCQLILDEGFTVIPALVNISINGSDKGRVCAMELLRLLRDITELDACDNFEQPVLNATRETGNPGREKKPLSWMSGIFGRKIFRLSKKEYPWRRKP